MTSIDSIKLKQQYSKNLEILFKNCISSDLPELDFFSKVKIDNLIIIFENIKKEKYSEIFSIDGNGLISLKIKKGETPNYIFNVGSEPIHYFDFKKNNNYRQMAIPHFVYYVAFMYNTLLVYEELFLKLYDKEAGENILDYSNSPVLLLNEKETFFSRFDYELVAIVNNHEFSNPSKSNIFFEKNMIKDMEAEGANLYILETDIENFYQNIYTHNLAQINDSELLSPIKTDTVAKYFEFLDGYNMKINLNHTKGIITGPISSSIASELLLLSIDKKISKFILNKKINYIRYVDDMVFYSSDLPDLEELNKYIQKTLREYNLDIKSEKTKISKHVRKRNQGIMVKLVHDFPYLDKNYTEEHILFVNDFVYIQTRISIWNDQGNFSQIKLFLTLFLKKLKKSMVLIHEDILTSFIKYLYKLSKLNCILISRNFKIIDHLIDIQTSEIKKKLIEEIDMQESETILDNFRNTTLEIWHYHILAKYSNSRYKDKIINSLIKESKKHQGITEYDISPIVLNFFITKDQKRNNRVFEYVIERYCEKTNDIQKSVWRAGISYSKWWLTLVELKFKGEFSEDKFDLLFKQKTGAIKEKQLGLMYEVLFTNEE